MTQKIDINETVSAIYIGSYLSPYEPQTYSQVPCTTRIFRFVWRGLVFNVTGLNLFWKIKDSIKESCHMYAVSVRNGDVFYIRHELLSNVWVIEKISSHVGAAWYFDQLQNKRKFRA